MSYSKNYIGKGKEVDRNGFKNLELKLELSALDKGIDIFTSESTGRKYVDVKVQKMKEADKYGNTHTCYVLRKEEEVIPTKQSAKVDAHGLQNNEPEDLPF